MNMSRNIKITTVLITTFLSLNGFSQTQKIASRLSQYSAVSEVIRYVFLLKGRKITRNSEELIDGRGSHGKS